MAHVTVSFDTFSTLPVKSLSTVISLTGTRGDCIDTYKEVFTPRGAAEMNLLITKICKNPILSVKVIDSKNVVLAQKSMQLISKVEPVSLNTKVGYGFALLILLMATWSLLSHARKYGPASILKRVVKKK